MAMTEKEFAKTLTNKKLFIITIESKVKKPIIDALSGYLVEGDNKEEALINAKNWFGDFKDKDIYINVVAEVKKTDKEINPLLTEQMREMYLWPKDAACKKNDAHPMS